MSDRPLELNAVTAACVLVRGEVFQRLGGFDEAYRNGYEDVDLCLKVRQAGLRIVYTPESVLVHHESVSEGRFDRNRENEDLLNRRWMGRFKDFDVDRRTMRPPPPRPGSRPPLSVVVPTRDALHHVAPCLEDLADQLAAGDEILVADAGSTDCTLQFVDQFSGEHPGLVRTVHAAGEPEPASAARAALAAARAGSVLFLPPSLRLERTFVSTFCGALLRLGPRALIASPVEGAGFCAAGAAGLLRALAERSPAVLLQEERAELEAAARALGEVRLVLLGGG